MLKGKRANWDPKFPRVVENCFEETTNKQVESLDCNSSSNGSIFQEEAGHVILVLLSVIV